MNRSRSLHSSLRRRTAGLHASTEAAVGRRRYFESAERYVDYLQRFAGFQSAAEQWLEGSDAAAWIPDWAARRRAHRARMDLELLGVRAESSAPSFELERQPEHVLGVVYVLEGSTLGGAVLLKQIAPLGVTATRFLASYGAQRGQMWQAFPRTLATWDERGVSHDAVAHAACETFELARHALTSAGRALSAPPLGHQPAPL